MGARICSTLHNRGDGCADDASRAATRPARPLQPRDTLALAESLEWLNELVAKLWPSVDRAAQRIIADKVEPQIQESLPAPLKGGVHFKRFTLGHKTPTFGPMKVYDAHHLGFKMIVGVDYQSDVNIEISTPVGNIGIKEVRLSGELMVWFSQLIDEVPVIGGVSVSFLSCPKLDLNFTGIGNIADMPGIAGALRGAIDSAIAKSVVLPNVIGTPMGTEQQGVDRTLVKQPLPTGVLRVTALRAQGLVGSDWRALGKATSDPYVQITVADECWRSSTVARNCDPQWKHADRNDFFVYSREQKVLVKVFDEDTLKHDDFIGGVEAPFTVVESLSQSEVPILLSDPQHPDRECGSLFLKFEWFELLPKQLDDAGCVLVVKVKRILLPAALGSEVAVQAQFGSVVKSTPVKRAAPGAATAADLRGTLADVARRCQGEGLDHEAIARITGLGCAEVPELLLHHGGDGAGSSGLAQGGGATVAIPVEASLLFKVASPGQFLSGFLGLNLVDRKGKALEGNPAANVELSAVRDAPGLHLAVPVSFVCNGDGLRIAAEVDVEAFGLKAAKFPRASVTGSAPYVGA